MMKLTQEQIGAGWRPWAGGDGPPAELAGVDLGGFLVMFRDGLTIASEYTAVDRWHWGHLCLDGDIIAYRIVEVTND